MPNCWILQRGCPKKQKQLIIIFPTVQLIFWWTNPTCFTMHGSTFRKYWRSKKISRGLHIQKSFMRFQMGNLMRPLSNAGEIFWINAPLICCCSSTTKGPLKQAQSKQRFWKKRRISEKKLQQTSPSLRVPWRRQNVIAKWSYSASN